MQTDRYHTAMLYYLDKFYQEFADESFYFGSQFIKVLAVEADKVSKSLGLKEMQYANAMSITCFRFAGVTNFLEQEGPQFTLLDDFAAQVNYPADDLLFIKNAISNNIAGMPPTGSVEMAAWDAIGSAFALDDFIVQLSFLREEMNRLNEKQYTEVELFTAFKERFSRTFFYSDYARNRFAERKERNMIKIVKRIQKLASSNTQESKERIRSTSILLSSKETEDLFKIAFRNYVHLVSVADSKAALLINVNSIIVSVVIGFVVGRSEKYPFLLIPSFILLTVCFLTIMLSIMASRPRNNRLIQNQSSTSYQTFFFGSFDLIENSFLKADWKIFSIELDSLLKGGKEHVYNQMYKETFNVRKVMAQKFTYLSIAYWVFLVGLFVSIVAFFFSTYRQ